jgi:N-acetyl-anhydromuramyl-L-alanine amidase AmpD
VSSKGEIVQYVEMNRWAYANGVIQPGWDDTLDWLVYCVANKINPNKRTISIEHEGYPGVPFPESQYQASLDLHKYIIQCWPGIKIDRKHIIGHYQISPKDRANCPGSTFPFNRLIADLRKELLPMPDTSDKVPGPIPVRPEFTAYWFKFGGLTVFGYPISNGYSVLNGAFGKAVFVQWFERARFELQPDGTILLGLVGREARDWYLVQGHTI